MDLQKQFATLAVLEIEGAWVKGPGGNSEFLIARAGNRKFQRELSREVELNQEVLDGKDDAADKCSDEIMGRVMSKTILLGWRGDVQYGGEAAVYTPDLACTMLTEMKDFRQWVNKKSDEREHFRVRAEKALGNA